MKLTRLSLLAAALAGAGGAFAAPIPAELAGSYQALLYSGEGDTSSPNALVALTLTSKGALSGKLTGQDNKTYAFKTKTALDYTAAEAPEGNDPLGTASSEVIEIKRPKMASLFLSLHFKDFEDSDVVEVSLKEGEADLASSDDGFKQITFAKGALPYDAAGSYTAAFELAEVPGQGVPAGSGYALGKIDAKGVFKLTGKTGDGTAFTASMAAGPDHRYLMFVNPYKRVNSFLAGKMTLTERTSGGFHMLPAETGYDLQWKKSSLLPKTTDKSYREGFGPLDVLVSMEPWVAPGKGETIADLFGISPLEIFEIGYDGEFPGANYAKYTPIKAGLTVQNTLRIAGGGTGSTFGFDPSLWAKVVTTKIDTKTGKFTATINIEDSIPASTPTGKAKIVKRKVSFEGVFLLPDVESVAPIAQGQIILPPLDPKTETVTSSMFAFSGNIVEDAIFAAAAPTAGTYKAIIIRQPNEPEDEGDVMVPYATGTPGPPAGANITFTISPDLRTLTFQGRVLKLRNDGRGTNNIITYDDLDTKFQNHCLVHMIVHGTSKQVTGIFATYNQFGVSGLKPIVKVSNFLQKDGSIIKQ